VFVLGFSVSQPSAPVAAHGVSNPAKHSLPAVAVCTYRQVSHSNCPSALWCLSILTRHLFLACAGPCIRDCARPTPWQFQHQAERFLPPYFFSSARPAISSVSAKEARYGATLTVRYTGRVSGAVLMSPAAVTHQVRPSETSYLYFEWYAHAVCLAW
jgi:hypothetical protein